MRICWQFSVQVLINIHWKGTGTSFKETESYQILKNINKLLLQFRQVQIPILSATLIILVPDNTYFALWRGIRGHVQMT